MHKRKTSYFIVAVLTIITACVGQHFSRVAQTAKFDANLESLPMKIGTWKGENVPLTGEVKTALNADHLLFREYTDSENGNSLGLLIVYRKYGRRDFAHRPELCYPAAGYEIVKKTYTKLPYDKRDVPARLVVAEKDYRRESVAYFFASGDRTEANFAKQQLWMALDRVQKRRNGWAFVRVNIPETYGHEKALETARSFMKLMDSSLSQVLTGNR